VTINDGGGNKLYESNFVGDWGAKTTVTGNGGDTKLPYDVTLTFLQSTATAKRRRAFRRDRSSRLDGREVAPPPVIPEPDWSSWGVDLTAGSTVWTSADTKDETGGKLPYCNMGTWTTTGAIDLDDHDTRSFDCYWAC
jgi:hypothetical protein